MSAGKRPGPTLAGSVLRDLLVRKGALEPWDRRPCAEATVNDLDLLALGDALQRMGVFSPERGVEPYLSGDAQLSPFVPSLCVREPLTGILRPRNFAMLLFGRDVLRGVRVVPEARYSFHDKVRTAQGCPRGHDGGWAAGGGGPPKRPPGGRDRRGPGPTRSALLDLTGRLR